MSILSLREINQSQLDTAPVIDGQIIICLDTGNAYRDSSIAHVKIGNDLEVVSELPLAPLANKLYYLRPDKLYAYNGGDWVLLNSSGAEFVGATTAVDGTKGAVPAPEKGGQRWLDSTGKWTVPENATQESAGFESPLDKIKLDGIEDGANNYVHPIYTAKNSGMYKITIDEQGHVSTATAIGKSDITGLGIPAQDTIYSVMKPATASTAGDSGLVPAPEAGRQDQFLRGDGIWAMPTNIQYNDATQFDHGLMTATDKKKLDAFGDANTYALKSDVVQTYRYKGSVTSVDKLPTSDQVIGDVYDVGDGMNYAWNGTKWDALGEIFTITKITNTEIDTVLAS